MSTGSPAETTVSIDDDAADVPDVSVRFGSGAYSVAEGASVSVTVTLSEAPERVLAVPIVVVSTVGATSGDYTVMPMSVSFAASETSKTLTFSAAGDGDDDDDESVVLGFDVSGRGVVGDVRGCRRGRRQRRRCRSTTTPLTCPTCR